MTDNKEVKVKISGDSKDLQKGLDTAEKKITTLSSKLRSMGSSIGSALAGAGKIAAVGLTALTGAIGGAIAAYKTQEQAEIRTRQTIAATGKAAGLSAEEIFKMASSLQNVTTFGDEAIIGGQNLLLTFRNIGGDVFPRVTEAMLDMSQAMGTDLKASAIQLGKALNDPTTGMAALTRVGVGFTDQQKEQITTLQKSGDVAGAQGVILSELENQFGGVARAAAGGTGKITQITNAAGDIAEKFGEAAMPAISALGTELLGLVNDGNEAQSMFKNFEDVIKAFSFGLLNVKRFVQAIGVVIGSVLGTAIGAATQAMEGNFAQAFETIKSSGDQFVDDMLEIDQGYQKSVENLDKEFAKSKAERENVKQFEEQAAKKEHFAKLLAQEQEFQKQKNSQAFDDARASIDNQKLMNEEELLAFKEKQSVKKEEEAITKALELEEAGKHTEAMKALDDIKTQSIIDNSNKAIAQKKKEADEQRKNSQIQTQIAQNFISAGIAMSAQGSSEMKALQSASSIISTYQGASAALAPPPIGAGPLLGPILAASTIAMGLANVAKINSTKMAKGGMYTGGINGVDSIPAIVQRGEITAPVKNYDEVIEGAIQQRGYVKDNGEGGGGVDVHISMSSNLINFIEAQVIERRSTGISKI